MHAHNPTTTSSMLELLRSAARKLLGRDDADTSPARLAALAVQALEQLEGHMAMLVGDMGIDALFARSVAVTSETFPWFASTTAPIATDPRWGWLRAVMERQDGRAIREGFVMLLSTFVELLGRLVGEGLVRRLLHDVWPEVFPQVVEEAT